MDDFIASLEGVAKDTRPLEDKERDYKTSNIVPGYVGVVWREKDDWKSYTPRNQGTSLSCMAQSAAKGLEVIKKIKENLTEIFSAHPPYRSRSNFPEGGMWLQDLFNQMKKVGTNYESVDVSQNIGETQMNRDIICETPFKVSGYGFPDVRNDINEIAKAIDLYGHCVIVIHANKREYTKPVPEIMPNLPVDFGHGICGVDYFMYKGERVIKIEDSTGHSTTFDTDGTRLLTEEFIRERCSDSGYITFEPPKYIFTTFMKRGYRSNEIKELQKRLNKEGFGVLAVDGIFGPLTQRAVIDYQLKKGLVPDGLVGPKTRAKLNA